MVARLVASSVSLFVARAGMRTSSCFPTCLVQCHSCASLEQGGQGRFRPRAVCEHWKKNHRYFFFVFCFLDVQGSPEETYSISALACGFHRRPWPVRILPSLPSSFTLGPSLPSCRGQKEGERSHIPCLLRVRRPTRCSAAANAMGADSAALRRLRFVESLIRSIFKLIDAANYA